MTIAARYLDALSEQAIAESAIDEALSAHLITAGGSDWEIVGDPYDSSLEVFVPHLLPEQVDALGAFVLSLGFARCWIHLHEGQRDKCGPGKCDRERYFTTVTA